MNFGYIYLLAAAIGLGLSYFLISFIFTKFFASSKAGSFKRSALSFAVITFFSILISAISLTMPHGPDNRFLHAFGGGFMIVLICFLSFKDHGFKMSRIQFSLMSVFLAMAFGTGNELLEFFLEKNFDLAANAGVYDTWLDLTSNTIGMFIALPLFLRFVRINSDR